jgi:hypothetical protein
MHPRLFLRSARLEEERQLIARLRPCGGSGTSRHRPTKPFIQKACGTHKRLCGLMRVAVRRSDQQQPGSEMPYQFLERLLYL